MEKVHIYILSGTKNAILKGRGLQEWFVTSQMIWEPIAETVGLICTVTL